MKHIINGIAETLVEYGQKSYLYPADKLPGYREKTAQDIFDYVLSELEINAEALRDRERRSISKEMYK